MATTRSMATITQLSELFGLTPRAIRFYEERGLVESGRDMFNRRLYDMPARERLRAIAELRRAGLGLEEIEGVLTLEDGEARNARIVEALDRRRDQLESDLNVLRVAMDRYQVQGARKVAA
ncbi:MerR family transcriptional regulator [Phenylobacterium aquaticum]|uniref:MerR family transcriptional regulator n=1 Tax=Phenylobacterium aquaticum TaxID=1763816 RepID=UPI0026F1AF75|nr:MerR family transcriptional regulator [Phenylobacterium aquaticum]